MIANNPIVPDRFNPVVFSIAISLCPAASSCHADTSTKSRDLLTRTKLDGNTLDLHNKDNHCAIQVHSNADVLTLDIPYPCGFVRTDRGSGAQTHYYDNVGHVLVVAGPPVEPEEYTEHGSVSAEHLCSDHGQPVFVKEGQLTAGKGEQSSRGFCHLLGFDEKVFYGFAHAVK